VDFLRALGLLTVLPVHVRWDEHTAPGRAMAFYPLAGALIGGALAGVAYLVGKTGVAGWADCCDALFVPVSRERRLEILHDPRLGSFGGIGLAVLLLVKLAAIQGVLASPSPLLALLVIPVAARWALVLAARVFPLARPDGMATRFREGLGWPEVAVATVTAALAAVLLVVVTGWRGLVPVGVAPLAMLAVARLAVSRLGGLTGDAYGAIVEVAETAALVAACLV
jgi:adenosylcobinamide-GDP ribazoletransferase